MKFEITTPILGFETIKEVELEKIDDIFMKMTSCEDENISFTLVNPYVLREYNFEIPNKIKEELDVGIESNLLIFNIVLIQNPIEDSIINFIGPLVFNTDVNKVTQVVISDSTTYGVAEKISSFLNS